MYNNPILDFLEEYKRLDVLCKSIFESEWGISEYIDEMDRNQQGAAAVSCWDKDYKQLKKMRGIRNKLVHEVNSFEANLFTKEDTEWLADFRARIIKRKDPLALLRQFTERSSKPTAKQESDIHTGSAADKTSYGSNVAIACVIFIVILLVIIFFS